LSVKYTNPVHLLIRQIIIRTYYGFLSNHTINQTSSAPNDHQSPRKVKFIIAI